MSHDPTPLHSFMLTPKTVERVWGTDSVAPWFTELERGKRIGEVWLTAEECRVTGSMATLADQASQFPEALGNADGNGFPLLIKLLYPSEKLSVQVHPNDEQAQTTLGQPRGKTECWYVLAAEPGAQVALGFREPMTTEQVRACIADGTIEDKLRLLTVKAGDMVYVDAGTVHAIGPGLVVLETQQYSDVTYRLWDYGRGRELHVEAGMAVTRTATEAGLVQPIVMHGFERLLACPYFAVDRLALAAGSSAALSDTGKMQVLIALGSGCTLHCGIQHDLVLQPGYAVVVPACEMACILLAQDTVEVIRVLGTGAA